MTELQALALALVLMFLSPFILICLGQHLMKWMDR